MVTVINKEIDPGEGDQDYWIRNGITSDAIWTCVEHWESEDYLNRNVNHDVIRNQPIIELNKW